MVSSLSMCADGSVILVFFCQDFPGKLVLSLAQSDPQRMGLFVCKL